MLIVAPQVRKCVGALWDALTTVKHLLENHESDTIDVEDILLNRLEATLDAFGGAREKADENDIANLISNPRFSLIKIH